MQTVHWELSQQIFGLKAAIVSDVHNRNHAEILRRVSAENPEIILIPGDLFSALNPEEQHYAPSAKHPNEPSFELLESFAKIAPTFFSLGNHESWTTEENRKKIASTGAVLLENTYVEHKGVLIGGLSSTLTHKNRKDPPPPDLKFLSDFAAQNGNKLLLSHHPEVFKKHVSAFDIDLVISGHAHGGQWRIGNQGIFAPGQGLFPKYTKGIYFDGKLAVSPGCANHTWVPRIFNPETVVILHI